ELKKCMEIVPDDGDEVLIEATPISSRSPAIIDYKIYKEGKKTYFKIIRANSNSQVYQTFEKMFKKFNREDLEVLWGIVKDRFKKEKLVDDMDNLLFKTLKTMFEHHVEDIIWTYQQGLAKMDYDVKMDYDLLRFIRKQQMEENTTMTKRPQPRSNTKNDRVPSISKSSCSKNKDVEVEEHPRNLLLSKNKKHMSSECNNIKLVIQNDKYEVVYAMCKVDFLSKMVMRVLLSLVLEGDPKFINISNGKVDKTYAYSMDPHTLKMMIQKHLWMEEQMKLQITPQQNRVVEQRNQTLVEAARTMLIFSRAPLFLWVEAIATTCYTQNRSIIYYRFNKTPYELINGRKTDISFLHVFGALCYPTNDRGDIGKLGAKCDIGFFIIQLLLVRTEFTIDG
nr:retrovirus-related Pol polyprotein from transposon TNT 1-94 [Tanacetum cinerariifolium]